MAITLQDTVQHGSNLDKYVVSLIVNADEGGATNFLDVCPVASVDTLTSTFLTDEDEGPSTGIGSRGLYGSFPEGTSGYKQRGFTAGNLGGRISVDQILKKQDPTLEKREIAKKARAIRRSLNNGAINGDRAATPNYVNGAKKFLVSNMDISINNGLFGSVANGLDVDASTTTQRAFIDAIEYMADLMPTGKNGENVYLFGNYDVQRQYNKAIRDLQMYGTNGAYYDMKSKEYRGIKWINPGANAPQKDPVAARANGVAVLPNNVSFGNATTATEVLAVYFSVDEGFAMYQLQPLKTTEIGRLQASPQEVTELEWWGGFFAKTDYCVARLRGLIVV
jgi:hypothetical protein